MYIKRNDLRIIELYTGDYNIRYYLRQISKISGIALKTCQDTIKILQKEKILLSKVEGKNKYFYLNLNNPKTKFFLIEAELYKTLRFIEFNPQFNSFIKELNTNQELLIIFGSYARFSAKKGSDLDLMMVTNNKKGLPYHFLALKTHEIKLSFESFKKALKSQEAIIKEVLKHHIILYNHSYFVELIWRYYGH